MIRQRRSGGQYYFEFMANGKRFNGVCEGCTTKREAQAFEAHQRELAAELGKIKTVDKLFDRRREEIAGRAGVPLATAFDEALKKPRRRTASPRVVDAKRNVWRDFVAFMAAKYPEVVDLAAVTAVHAEAYIGHVSTSGKFDPEVVYERGGKTITRAATRGLSSRTVLTYLAVCKEVFARLRNDAALARNPFDEVEPPAKNCETREPFTPEELKLIAENLDDFTRPLFTVAFMTALREGDICTLRWREINFESRTIRRTMNKTGRLVEIPIAPSLQAYLEEQYAKTGGGEYVFPELAEMYSDNPSGVSYRVKSFLEDLGIETTRTPAGRTRAVSVKDLHSCRHTFCYLAGMQGIPLAVVQSIVGHMSPEMTAHYAAHATLEDKRRGIEAMPEFITAAADSTPATAMIESDAERAALLLEIEAMPTDEIRNMLNLYRGACR